MYYRKGAHAQVYAILKNTTKKGRLTNINKNFEWTELSKINVNNDEVQNDWEIAREILCKIPRSPVFYKNVKNRLEIEIAGKCLKIFLSKSHQKLKIFFEKFIFKIKRLKFSRKDMRIQEILDRKIREGERARQEFSDLDLD